MCVEDALYAHRVDIPDSREYRERQLAVIRALLECGASPNARRNEARFGVSVRNEQPLALDPILRQVLV